MAYEDRTTTDPSQLNAALTGTRPQDIERHEEAIADARQELINIGRPLDEDRDAYRDKLEGDRDKTFYLSGDRPVVVTGPGEGNLADGDHTEGVNDLPPGTAASEDAGVPVHGADDDQGAGGQPPAGVDVPDGEDTVVAGVPGEVEAPSRPTPGGAAGSTVVE